MPYLSQSASSAPQGSSAKATDAFHQLVQELSDALGPTSGLDSDDVDPAAIQRLMEGYTSNPRDWEQYALSDRSRAYTRNLVDEGNGKSNLVRPQHKSLTASVLLIRNSLSWSGLPARRAQSTTTPMRTAS